MIKKSILQLPRQGDHIHLKNILMITNFLFYFDVQLAAALGVIKLITVIAMNLVTLSCLS
jgi:hypothetical protein